MRFQFVLESDRVKGVSEKGLQMSVVMQLTFCLLVSCQQFGAICQLSFKWLLMITSS